MRRAVPWAVGAVAVLAAVAWGEWRAAGLRAELEAFREDIAEEVVTRRVVEGDGPNAPGRIEAVADGKVVAVRDFQGGALKTLVAAFPDGGNISVSDMTNGSAGLGTGPLGPGLNVVGPDGVIRHDAPAMGGFGGGMRSFPSQSKWTTTSPASVIR